MGHRVRRHHYQPTLSALGIYLERQSGNLAGRRRRSHRRWNQLSCGSRYLAGQRQCPGLGEFRSPARPGIPDVAGNASPNSGYQLFLYGQPTSQLLITSGPGAGSPLGVVGGTSAVAPLYAALVALINASLNKKVGYLNPTLYSVGASGVFRDINDGISNSVSWTNDDGSVGGPSAGYSSGPGWDACTGWGSINGNALLNSLAAPSTGASQATPSQAVHS